jgi:putative nucleotidyltransferase with HDIG domain
MPADTRPRKLRADYQVRVEPTAAARETSRMSETIMSNSSTTGLTAPPAYNSFGGGSRAAAFARQLAAEDARAIVWALVLYAAAGVVGFVSAGRWSLPSWELLVALAVIAAVAERQSVRLTPRLETSVAFLPIMLAALAYGPGAACLVAAGANLLNLERPYLRWFAYTPIRALEGTAAGWAAVLLLPDRPRFTAILLASCAASAAYNFVDLGLNVATGAIRRSERPLVLVRTLGPLLALSVPLYVPLVAIFVYGYRTYSIWVACGFLLPVVAMQRLSRLYQEQRETADRLAVANGRLERANLSFATALVATLDARDRYTAGHSAAVAIYARDIASQLGLPESDQQLAHLCGLVHDIGKIGLPAGLLEKPGALTPDERRQMEEHSEIGERILAKVDDYAEIASIVRHHHERLDGAGYPDRLAGEAIPLMSRIIAVADAYNAMTSDRPYRDAMPSLVARSRLAQAMGSQFDRSVALAFEAVLEAEDENYRMGRSPEFILESHALLRPVLANVA